MDIYTQDVGSTYYLINITVLCIVLVYALYVSQNDGIWKACIACARSVLCIKLMS